MVSISTSRVSGRNAARMLLTSAGSAKLVAMPRPVPAVHQETQPEEMAAVAAAGYRVVVNNRPDGEVPGRLAPAEELRLGGLIWPEARERLGDSAWALREGLGHGQVLLFAHSPVFRGSWRGSGRLLGNAVVVGPGAGADPHPRR